jgi:hypothetical protein
VDREVYYQLKENFNPWDLIKSVHKQTERHVDFFTGTGSQTLFILEDTPVWIPGKSPYDHFAYHDINTDYGNWWGYPNPDIQQSRGIFENSPEFLAAGFSERVLVDGELQERGYDYDIYADGRIIFMSAPSSGDIIKVLYSRLGSTSYYDSDYMSNILPYFTLDHSRGVYYYEWDEDFDFAPIMMAVVHLEFNGSSPPRDSTFILHDPEKTQDKVDLNVGNLTANEWGIPGNITATLDGGEPGTEGKVTIRIEANQTQFETLNQTSLWKYYKAFHWLQTKVDVFNEKVDVDSYDEIHLYLSHTPLTTAEVIIEILNATTLVWPGESVDDTASAEGVEIANTTKILLDKYENTIRVDNIKVNDSQTMDIEARLDFGSGHLHIEFYKQTGADIEDLLVEVKVVYTPVLGSYEWIVAGREHKSVSVAGYEDKGSWAVDNLGAAMITEAFDSLKNIEVWWSGLDVQDNMVLTVPYVMSKVGSTPVKTDYRYDEAGGDYRSALRDDWSSTVPIASSNMIVVGGPAANQLAEYFNEFTPVIYRGIFDDKYDLLPVSCWGMAHDSHPGTPVFGADGQGEYGFPLPANTGYAIIATYLDINGTAGFIVWGLTGDDTYWASTALWQEGDAVSIYKYTWYDSTTTGVYGDMDSDDPFYEMAVDMPLIEWLQEENPGITALIIKIDYSQEGSMYTNDIHPKLVIMEELGTISEKPQHDP